MKPTAIAFLPRAKREIDEADEWWAESHAGPSPIHDAIARFLTLISEQPYIGAPFAARRVRDCRRLLLTDVDYWVYYCLRGARVEVLSLWHVRRGRGPGL